MLLCHSSRTVTKTADKQGYSIFPISRHLFTSTTNFFLPQIFFFFFEKWKECSQVIKIDYLSLTEHDHGLVFLSPLKLYTWLVTFVMIRFSKFQNTQKLQDKASWDDSVRCLLNKPGDQSSIPRAHIKVERENQLNKVVQLHMRSVALFSALAMLGLEPRTVHARQTLH